MKTRFSLYFKSFALAWKNSVISRWLSMGILTRITKDWDFTRTVITLDWILNPL